MTFPSLLDAPPNEEGGPIARSGFDYQDELALSLAIEMLGNDEITCLLCETHDDIVIYRESTIESTAEFIQVKAEEPYQYWSTSMICLRKSGNKLSLVEKSLLNDRFSQSAKFRIVTSAPTNKELSILRKQPASRDDKDSDRVLKLNEKLIDQLGEIKSTRGNDFLYWLENCWWDVRHDLDTLKSENLIALLELAQKERRPANLFQLGKFRTTLLELIKSAGAARWSNHDNKKNIWRSDLRCLWNRLVPKTSQYGAHRQISKFQRDYLISELGEVPFGGRVEELMALDDWLNDDDSDSRALLIAPSGRGKSALIIHWLLRLQNSARKQQWKPIFMPISMRYSTHLPRTYWQGIAFQLAEIFVEVIPHPIGDPGHYYAEVCANYLERISTQDQKIVVIVDGVDEAADQNFDGSIFPEFVSKNLKVLVSAREFANDNSTAWCKRLNWRSATRFSLPLLKSSDIEELIIRHQVIPSALDKNKLVEKLVLLTECEPLLVMLFIEDLTRLVREQGSYCLKDLENLTPGFSSYIENWIDTQRKLWQQEKQYFNDRTIDATFAVLACAFGPLTADDLITLVSSLSQQSPALSPLELIRPIKRFVIGDGTEFNGYVFNHPKLSQYFLENYLSQHSIHTTHEKFVEWGSVMVEKINKQEPVTPSTPSYLLEHYVRHLIVTNGDIKNFQSILTRQWHDAWEKLEGGHRGFAANIQMVLKGIGPIREWTSNTADVLLTRIRASMYIGTVYSFSASLPLELVVLALKDGVVTLNQAISHIEMQEEDSKNLAYCQISAYLPLEQRLELTGILLSINDPHTRVQYALKSISTCESILHNEITDIIEDALLQISNEPGKSALLVESLPYRGINHIKSTIDALNEKNTLPEHKTYIYSLYGKIIRYLLANRIAVSSDLITNFHASFTNFDCLSQVSSILIEYCDILEKIGLPENFEKIRFQAHDFFEAAIKKQFTGQIDVTDWSQLEITATAHLALHLIAQLKSNNDEVLLTGAWQIVEKVRQPYTAAETLISCIPLFPRTIRAAVVEKVLEIIERLGSANNKTHSLLALVQKLDVAERRPLLIQALNCAKLIEDHNSVALTLSSIYTEFSAEQKLARLPELLNIISAIPDPIRRGELLISISSTTREICGIDLAPSGLQTIQFSAFTNFRDTALINAIPKLRDESQKSAFKLCMQSTLSWPASRDFFFSVHIKMLARAAPLLWSEENLNSVLERVTSTTPFSVDLLASLIPIALRYRRADVVKKIEGLLSVPGSAIRNSSALARLCVDLNNFALMRNLVIQYHNEILTLTNNSERVRSLTSLIPHLPSELKEHAINSCIQGAMASPNDERVNLLVALAETIDDLIKKESLLTYAYDFSITLPINQRCEAMRRLIPHFSDLRRTTHFINVLTSGIEVSRSTLLCMLGDSAPLLSELGGDELLSTAWSEIVSITKSLP